MDILHCGSSLGAGGLALVEADSLFRLGSVSSYIYKKITEGPVRTIFLLCGGWKTKNGMIAELVTSHRDFCLESDQLIPIR
jgi:hypothetical protein